MSKILSIDPGSCFSGYVVYNSCNHKIIGRGNVCNDEMMMVIVASTPYADNFKVLIEFPKAIGMPACNEMIETAVWCGKFELTAQRSDLDVVRWDRKETIRWSGWHPAKKGQKNVSKDSVVRQACINEFGGTKEKAIGLKKTPGPLYGITADCWQALGSALAYVESEARK